MRAPARALSEFLRENQRVKRLMRNELLYVMHMPDGTVVDPVHYTVTGGSTVITFKESYLQTLTIETHLFRVQSTNYYVDLILTYDAGEWKLGVES